MGIFTVALLLLAIEFLLRLGRADAAAGTADDPLNKAGF